MSPHAERGTDTRHTELTAERGRKGKGGGYLKMCSHAKAMLFENTISMKDTNMSPIRSTWNRGACMYPHTTDQLRESWHSLL